MALRPSKLLCFFFQAEDGIRGGRVTGVQTCALPISFPSRSLMMLSAATIRNTMSDLEGKGFLYHPHTSAGRIPRSEERRVGKECRSRWSTYHYTKNSVTHRSQLYPAHRTDTTTYTLT